MPTEVTGNKREPITFDGHNQVFASEDGETVLRVDDNGDETEVAFIKKGEETLQTIEDGQQFIFDLSEKERITVSRMRSVA